MAIGKLADSDVRALRSSQVCSDVLSTVKELIENSLDAHATAITIQLEGYGLDELSVKDNGAGIPTADRHVVAARYHTSKLAAMHELKNVRTYGFRGEALASLREIAGKFSIITHVAGEAVASVLQFDDSEQLRVVKTCADPVGTTIIATKLFQRHPVRRDKFRKEGSRNSAKLKSLLAAYAIARPDIRFQAIVKSGKKSESPAIITFNTAPDRLTAFERLLGPDASGKYDRACQTESDFAFELILPRKSVGPAHAGGRSYVLVDGRPLDATQGFAKEMASTMKNALKEHLDLSSPAFVASLTCPPGAYDPNCERKSQVIFDDGALILSTLSGAVVAHYQAIDPVSIPGQVTLNEASCEDGGRPLTPQTGPVADLPRQSSYQNSMFDPPDLQQLSTPGVRPEDEMDSAGSAAPPATPWTIAKTTSVRRPPQASLSRDPPASHWKPPAVNAAQQSPASSRCPTTPTSNPKTCTPREHTIKRPRLMQEDEAPRVSLPKLRDGSLDEYVAAQSIVKQMPRRQPDRQHGLVYNHDDVLPSPRSQASTAPISADATRSPAKDGLRTLDKTPVSQQVHKLELAITLPTLRKAGSSSGRHNKYCNVGGQRLRRDLAETADVRILARIEAGMRLMTVRDAAGKLLGVFAAKDDDRLQARLDALHASAYRNLKMTGDSAGVVRLW